MAIRRPYGFPGILVALLAAPGALADSQPGWQIEVEGLPLLSGKNVMPMTIGDIRKSNLMGANAIVNFSVVGTESVQITGAQVYYLDSGTRCDRGHGSPGTGELVVERDGERILVSGRISCQSTAGGDAGMRAISGWYRD